MTAARTLRPAPAEQPWAVLVKEDLAAALEGPAAVADRRPTVPVLACLRLEVDRGELAILGTDTDLWVETRCPTRERDWRPGAAAAVDAELLRAVVAAAPKAGEIRIELAPTGLLVGHALERARLPVLPAEEFPAMRRWEDQPWRVRVDGEKLAAGLARVADAISREETRYYLNGVHLALGRSWVELTATDGHRLHHTRVEALRIAPEDGARELILPRRLVELLRRATGEWFLDLHPAGVTAKGGLGTIASRVIEGQFPDWRRIVPAERPDRLELTGDEVVEAVKRLKRFGDGALTARLAPERLSLQGGSDADGLAETSVAGRPQGAPAELETGLQGRYLADAARVAGDGNLLLGWSAASAPLRLDFPDRPDDVVIVMPMRGTGWREVA